MGLTLSCRDLESTCTYVAHGKNEKELMVDMDKHAKEVHGYTDEQLKDPEMRKKIKAAIKKE